MVNAQPICFTADPFATDARRGVTRLLNGQHRLYGVIEANTAIEVPVAVGIAESAFATYDTHARRSVFTAGGPQADLRVLAGAARFQWRVDQGLRPNDRAVPSASEIKETLARVATVLDHVENRRKRLINGQMVGNGVKFATSRMVKLGADWIPVTISADTDALADASGWRAGRVRRTARHRTDWHIPTSPLAG